MGEFLAQAMSLGVDEALISSCGGMKSLEFWTWLAAQKLHELQQLAARVMSWGGDFCTVHQAYTTALQAHQSEQVEAFWQCFGYDNIQSLSGLFRFLYAGAYRYGFDDDTIQIVMLEVMSALSDGSVRNPIGMFFSRLKPRRIDVYRRTSREATGGPEHGPAVDAVSGASPEGEAAVQEFLGALDERLYALLLALFGEAERRPRTTHYRDLNRLKKRVREAFC